MQFRRARKQHPDDQFLYITLAELMLGTGRRRRGLHLLFKAVEDDAQFRRARFRLAQELAFGGETQPAIWHAKVLVEFDPNDREAKDLLQKLAGETAVREIEAAARKAAEKSPTAGTQQAPEGAQESGDDEFELEVGE